LVSLERERQRGVLLLKRRYFAAIGSCSVKTALQIGTDMLLILTSTIVTSFLGVSTSMALNDLEPPKWGFLVNFSLFRAATHILKVNCAEMAANRPGQPAYEILTIKRRF